MQIVRKLRGGSHQLLAGDEGQPLYEEVGDVTKALPGIFIPTFADYKFINVSPAICPNYQLQTNLLSSQLPSTQDP
jgi:hypothetical protein